MNQVRVRVRVRARAWDRDRVRVRDSVRAGLDPSPSPNPNPNPNQKHLLRFIKKKMRVSPYEIVATSSDGAPMTLSQVFDEMGIRPYDLNLDSLGMHADPSIFCRFDKFNLKYNPLGKSRLREIFLKSENPQLVARALRSVFQRRPIGLPGPSEGSGCSYTTRSAASAAWKPAVAPVARPRPPQS